MTCDAAARPGGTFLRTSALLMMARLGGAALGVGTQIGLAWLLPPSELGVFFMATSLAAVAGTAAALGYPSVAVRFLVRYAERAKPLAAAAFVRCARRDATLLAGALAAALLAAVLSGVVGEANALLALAAAAPAIPAIALLRVNGGIANAGRRFQIASLPDLVLRPLLLLLGIGAYVLVGQLSAISVCLLFAAAAILAALFQAVAVRPFAPRAETLQSPRRLVSLWRATARPMVLVTLYTALFADICILFAGLMLTSQDLAQFAIAMKLGFLVGFAVQLAHGMAAPDIAAGYASRNSSRMAPAIRRANVLSVASTGLAFLACLLAGELILGLFGAGYESAWLQLALIVASQVVRAGFGPSITLLTVIGAQRQVAVMVAATLAVLFALMASLVPAWGATGAALAVLVTTALSSFGFAVLLHRTAGLRTDTAALLQDGLAMRLSRSLS